MLGVPATSLLICIHEIDFRNTSNWMFVICTLMIVYIIARVFGRKYNACYYSYHLLLACVHCWRLSVHYKLSLTTSRTTSDRLRLPLTWTDGQETSATAESRCCQHVSISWRVTADIYQSLHNTLKNIAFVTDIIFIFDLVVIVISNAEVRVAVSDTALSTLLPSRRLVGSTRTMLSSSTPSSSTFIMVVVAINVAVRLIVTAAATTSCRCLLDHHVTRWSTAIVRRFATFQWARRCCMLALLPLPHCSLPCLCELQPRYFAGDVIVI